MGRILVFAEHGNAAAFQHLRRKAAKGEIEQIHPGIFVTPGEEPIEMTIRFNWPRLVGYLFPEGVVTDRSGMECQPTQRKDDTNFYIFVSAPKSPRTVLLPGLVISQRRGPGPLKDEDVPFMGTWMAGPVRRVLDNMTLSRARKTPPRTFSPEEMETWLEEYCSIKGEDALNALRDNARRVADKLSDSEKFNDLNAMINALLGTRKRQLLTYAGNMRAMGYPIDTSCLGRIQSLYAHLSRHPIKEIPDAVTSRHAQVNSCFFESYFSNYIEGTKFLVKEAEEIVFKGRIPKHRPEDGHDVLKIWNELVEPPRSGLEKSAEEFILGLQKRHYKIMVQRPDIQPGELKAISNVAGNTVFVAPEKVRGTLLEGFGIIQATTEPFARAVLAHYLISEVHPFTDGNGRLSRMVMTRELVSNGLSHAVVATAFRNDYLDGLRALSNRNNPDIFVRSILKCQEVSAACVSEDFDEALALWAESYAFLEDGRHVDFSIPKRALEIEWRAGVPAPASYWRALDRDVQDDGPDIL